MLLDFLLIISQDFNLLFLPRTFYDTNQTQAAALVVHNFLPIYKSGAGIVLIESPLTPLLVSRFSYILR